MMRLLKTNKTPYVYALNHWNALCLYKTNETPYVYTRDQWDSIYIQETNETPYVCARDQWDSICMCKRPMRLHMCIQETNMLILCRHSLTTAVCLPPFFLPGPHIIVDKLHINVSFTIECQLRMSLGITIRAKVYINNLVLSTKWNQDYLSYTLIWLSDNISMIDSFLWNYFYILAIRICSCMKNPKTNRQWL